jgi:hypothetical protein
VARHAPALFGRLGYGPATGTGAQMSIGSERRGVERNSSLANGNGLDYGGILPDNAAPLHPFGETCGSHFPSLGFAMTSDHAAV